MPTIALLGWPLAMLAIFARQPVASALVWTVIVGHLFLPQGIAFDFPGVPAFDKTSIPAVTLVVAVLIFGRRGRRGVPDAPPLVDAGPGVGRVLICLALLLVVSPLLTVLSNADGVSVGARWLPGLRMWDVFNVSAGLLAPIVPFFVARRYLVTVESHRLVLRALLVMGLVYSLLILIEIRMSPQLNVWIYGYFQHSFAQHVRAGGYRPIVFLPHGLWVGFFLFSVVVAAVALVRVSPKGTTRTRYVWAALWMLLILSLSRNLGAMALALMLAPLVLLVPALWQARVAMAVSLVVLFYPAVRQAGLIPMDRITRIAASISQDRAQSLQFRFRNEDQLLERALERPVAGWGGWGRSRVYDPETGNDISTTDGYWIVILGTSGWVGYIALLGLLTMPVIALPRTARRKPLPPETAALGLIMAGNFIYMVPNSTLSPIGWMMAGALAGFAQFDLVRAAPPAEARPLPRNAARAPRYTRFGKSAPAPASAPASASAPARRSGRSPHRRSTSTP
ncbi:hypothetical protein OCGS_2600 [Oceaniovalibus guishaninsula JLT2003]|uniref:O-antigen ligase-related domain-containing protein n=1 Tax=Oceaniovalibus guishaninsula JLT2003 TaxID=1231392 RepID=K2H6K0_9RHOB|nr:O-antigen ligase family protein [Oceaniovalibus guishaninsula]EKE43263.1 hypothetical protein OCGS_2600 [Oceaniovalibus guishaninsula JLT2003]